MEIDSHEETSEEINESRNISWFGNNIIFDLIFNNALKIISLKLVFENGIIINLMI